MNIGQSRAATRQVVSTSQRPRTGRPRKAQKSRAHEIIPAGHVIAGRGLTPTNLNVGEYLGLTRNAVNYYRQRPEIRAMWIWGKPCSPAAPRRSPDEDKARILACADAMVSQGKSPSTRAIAAKLKMGVVRVQTFRAELIREGRWRHAVLLSGWQSKRRAMIAEPDSRKALIEAMWKRRHR